MTKATFVCCFRIVFLGDHVHRCLIVIFSCCFIIDMCLIVFYRRNKATTSTYTASVSSIRRTRAASSMGSARSSGLTMSIIFDNTFYLDIRFD